jgi:hypothetical protein
MHWKWCRGGQYTLIQKKQKFVFGENDTPDNFIHHIMQEYDSKCLKMYLITLKAPIWPRSMKGSQIHLALAHWKWHYSSGWKII